MEDETLENEDVEPKEETTPKKGKKNKKPKEEVKQEETLKEVQAINEDGFIAGQEIDSKTYFEFIAKQRNS